MSSFQVTIIYYLVNIVYNTAEDILCRDAAACIDQIPLSNSKVHCRGALSCNGASNISASELILCYGSHACSDIIGSSVMTTIGTIYCSGSNSCSYSNIKGRATSTSVLCRGYLSCANSYILSTKTIYGRGAYSLYNATIESAGTLYIYLSGYYAGFGANIICHSNDICNIWCYFNGCYMTYLDCDEGAQCNIYSVTSDAIRAITDISLLDLTVHLQHLFQDETINNDKECSNNNKSMTFDLYRQHDFGTIYTMNDDYICCRGEASCDSNNIIHIGNTTKAKLICSGYNSCVYSNITTDYAVSCEGGYSCYESAQITTNYIHCFGYFSCYNSTIYHAINITCAGSESCYNANIYTSNSGKVHHIYFIGYNAGRNSTIYCKTNDECFILCGAYDSCLNTTLICYGTCTVEYLNIATNDSVIAVNHTVFPSISTSGTLSVSTMDSSNVKNDNVMIVILVSVCGGVLLGIICTVIFIYIYRRLNKEEDVTETVGNIEFAMHRDDVMKNAIKENHILMEERPRDIVKQHDVGENRKAEGSIFDSGDNDASKRTNNIAGDEFIIEADDDLIDTKQP